jgi:hypothetical protein
MKNIDENITNNKLLTVLFKNPGDADQAFNYLISKGFDRNDITVVMSDETRNKNFGNINASEDSLGSKAIEGMGVGGAIGGTVGAIAAAIAAIGTVLVLPGLGLVVAGPIAAAVAGAGAGSAIGGIVGALVGSGIPDEKAKQYEEDIKAGGILIGIKAPNEKYDELEKELNTFNSNI